MALCECALRSGNHKVTCEGRLHFNEVLAPIAAGCSSLADLAGCGFAPCRDVVARVAVVYRHPRYWQTSAVKTSSLFRETPTLSGLARRAPTNISPGSRPFRTIEPPVERRIVPIQQTAQPEALRCVVVEPAKYCESAMIDVAHPGRVSCNCKCAECRANRDDVVGVA